MNNNNSDIALTGYSISVHHLHPRNSTDNDRLRSKYRSVAVVKNCKGVVLFETDARCHPSDVPSRKMGYAIAYNRATKLLREFLQDSSNILNNTKLIMQSMEQTVNSMEDVQLGLADAKTTKNTMRACSWVK